MSKEKVVIKQGPYKVYYDEQGEVVGVEKLKEALSVGKVFCNIKTYVKGKLAKEKKLEVSSKNPLLSTCGVEIADDVPIEIPLEIQERLKKGGLNPRETVKAILAAEAKKAIYEGNESPEDFYDLDPDDNDLQTSYEMESNFNDVMRMQSSEFQEQQPSSPKSSPEQSEGEGAPATVEGAAE